MEVTRRTTAEEFAAGTGWHFACRSQEPRFRAAFDYFMQLSNVPLAVLNKPETDPEVRVGVGHRRAWGPPSGSRWTWLFSRIQAINLSCSVNPRRGLVRTSRLKQYRWPGEPMKKQGDWFTWESTRLRVMGLPDGQTAIRIFEVIRPVMCLESTIADAFTWWAGKPGQSRDYHHGGGKQLFVYGGGPDASAFRVIGGAK